MASTPSSCDTCGAALHPRFDAVIDPQTREVFRIEACVECGLGHTTPHPDDLGRHYGPHYHGGRYGFTQRLTLFRRHRWVLKMAGGPGRLLDVGCGDGAFLLHLKEKGWDVQGTELNPGLARAAGLPVFERLEDTEGPFDVVTSWHTLEHMRSPRQTLAGIAKKLRPGGWLLVAVPDAGGVQARLFGDKWFHLDVPRHLFHFDLTSLRTALGRAGFSVERSWHRELEQDLFGFTQSALNRVLKSPNVLFSRLTGRPTTASSLELAVSVVLGTGVTALALPAVPASSAVGRGAVLVVAARRT